MTSELQILVNKDDMSSVDERITISCCGKYFLFAYASIK